MIHGLNGYLIVLCTANVQAQHNTLNCTPIYTYIKYIMDAALHCKCNLHNIVIIVLLLLFFTVLHIYVN